MSQKIESTLARAPGVSAIRRQVEEAQRRSWLAENWSSLPWAGLTPRTLCLILLSGVSGFAHFYLIGRRRVGVWLFAVSVVFLALAAIFIKSPVSDWLLYCVIGLSMFSMSAGIVELRRARQNIDNQILAWIGIGLLVFSLYTGGYTILRFAARPWANVVTVMIPTSPLVKQGDSLLLWSRGKFGRGDLALCMIQWQGEQVLSIGRLIGLPRDKIEIDRQVRVNGKTLDVPLPLIAGVNGEPVAPSEYYTSAKTLGRDEYWIVPNFNYAPSSQAIVETGIIHRADIWGRVVAITGPAERRRLVHREPARAE